jgi:hypothetical protein
MATASEIATKLKMTTVQKDLDDHTDASVYDVGHVP